MPRNPNSPHKPGCGPMHTHISASENIKLQMMMAKLEDSLKNEFVLKEQLKTINSESLVDKDAGNIDITYIKDIKKTATEGLVDTYTIYFNNAEPYSFTVTNGTKGDKGDTGKSITSAELNEGKELVLSFSDGTSANLGNVQGKQGIGITAINVSEEGELTVTFTDGKNVNLGSIKGPPGDPGSNGINGVSITDASINENGELVISFSKGDSKTLGKVVGTDGIIPKIKVGEKEFSQESGVISLPPYATETFVTQKVTELVDSAPETLDTLGELATALKTHTDAYGALLEIVGKKADEGHTHDDRYITEHQDISGKQDVITDLAEIRAGAALGKTALQSVPTEYVTETELSAKGYLTEHQSLTDYAKKSELFSKNYSDLSNKPELFSGNYEDLSNKPEIPSIEGLATEAWVESQNYATIAALTTKADNIPFKEDKYVTNPVGLFSAGESIKGLSVAEILAKLLGLSAEPTTPEEPEIPQGIVGTIMSNKTSMYQIDANDTLQEVPYTLITYQSPADGINDGQTGFYQVVDAENNRIEAGYQHYSTPKEPWYIVALPEVLNLYEGGNTLVYSWSTLENKWVQTDPLTLTNDYAAIKAEYDNIGIEAPVAPEGYQLWADLSRSDPGELYRFIIKE